MKEARQKAYNIFPSSLLDDSRTRQVNIVKYIEHLGQTTKTPIDGWPIMEVFQNPETKLLHTHRSTINKLFFEFRDKVPESPKGPEGVAQVVSEKLLKSCKYFVDAAYDTAKREYQHAEQRVFDYSREVETAQYKMTKAKLMQDGLAQAKASGCKELRDSITDLITRGDYELHPVQNHSVLRLLTKEITLSFFNQAQAATNVVPMGRYAVTLSMSGNGLILVQVLPAQNNPRAENGIWHPHVNQKGTVCWGNMLSAYNTAAASFDVVRVAEIVMECLTNYNDGNPHVSLYKLEDAWKLGRYATPATFVPDFINADDDRLDDPPDEDESEDEEPEDGADEEAPAPPPAAALTDTVDLGGYGSSAATITIEDVERVRNQLFDRSESNNG